MKKIHSALIALSLIMFFSLKTANANTSDVNSCHGVQPTDVAENSQQKNGLYLVTEASQDAEVEQQVLEKLPVVTLTDIEDVSVSTGQYHPSLNLTLTDTAGKTMSDVTWGKMGRKMAFVIQDKVLVSATIQAVLSSQFQISFDTVADAQKHHDIVSCFIKKPKQTLFQRIMAIF